MLDLLADYGLDDFYLELSTRNRSDKFVGSDEDWEEATARCWSEVASESGLELVADPGGAAFYGPKISVQARDALGRTWQMSTIQFDFNQPDRFDLDYSAPDGTRQQPVMIHRALVRLHRAVLRRAHRALRGGVPGLAVAGAGGRHPGRRRVRRPPRGRRSTELRGRGIRAEVDHSDDRMQKKIRTHTTGKVPFLLLAGEKDVEARAVSFRFRDGTQVNGVPVAQAVDAIDGWVRGRSNHLADRRGFATWSAGGRAAAVRRGRSSRRVADGPDLVQQDGVGVPDHLQRLWTPHRMAYVTGGSGADQADDDAADEGCPFCRIPTLSDEDGLIVARGEQVYAVLNLFPYNPGT